MALDHRTLAQIVTDHPKAADVFVRHGLDFCCRGQRSLGDACREAGIDAAALRVELTAAVGLLSEAELANAGERHPGGERMVEGARRAGAAAPHDQMVDGGELPWSERPLGELIDHIIERYHEPLRRELPALVTLARTVESVHASKPAVPVGLTEHLERVEAAVASHLAKEERILFPLIRAGRGETAYMPIKVMMQEHEDHGESLRRTRTITRDFELPSDACASWRGLYRGLGRLEAELWKHIHLENYLLFPRATEPSSATATQL